MCSWEGRRWVAKTIFIFEVFLVMVLFALSTPKNLDIYLKEHILNNHLYLVI